MAAVVSWYGPLIDLSAAAGHVGGFAQLLVSVQRVLPHQEQNATDGRTFQKTMLEVGDDTRSRFCVLLWPKHSSTILAGDVLLLQNIKIVEFRNGLEGRASQISAVQVLLNSKGLVKQGGIDELISDCKVGDNTRSKLRRVVEWIWIQHTRCSLTENCHEAALKNWKGKEKESGGSLPISELLSHNKLHSVSVYASICKMVLMGSLTSHFNGKFSVIERLSLKEHNDIFRNLITTGCKLCGLPLYPKNLHGERTYPIDCPKNPKYIHNMGQIYIPFMVRA